MPTINLAGLSAIGFALWALFPQLSLASPAMEIFSAREEVLNLDQATQNFPQEKEIPGKYLKKTSGNPTVKVPPDSILRSLQAFVFVAQKGAHNVDRKFEKALNDFQENARWADQVQGPIGLASDRILIVEIKNPHLILVFRLWPKTAQACVGTRCGANLFQIINESKVAEVTDERLVSLLWMAAMRSGK